MKSNALALIEPPRPLGEHTEQRAPEEIAEELLAELTRLGRYRGRGCVVIQPENALASIGCIVRTAQKESRQ